MIKIEVTGNSIPEVADKLLAIGASLRASGAPVEVAKEAPVDPTLNRPTSDASVTSPDTSRGTYYPTPKSAPVTYYPTPKSAPVVEAIDSPPTTVEPSSTPAASVSEIDFELDVAPVVLRAVSSKGKPFVQDILSEFGSVRASQLAVDLWPELIARLEAEMA
jgi:hypothetical protein